MARHLVHSLTERHINLPHTHSLWILFPFLVASALGGTIATSLRNHARDIAIEEEALRAAFPAPDAAATKDVATVSHDQDVTMSK
jgi:hypothetical protein